MGKHWLKLALNGSKDHTVPSYSASEDTLSFSSYPQTYPAAVACSRCASPRLLVPSPCPSELFPTKPPSAGRPEPSYLSAPRSGRLLVPRPQSPFDPLLGSEPCDPVGGPQLSSVQAARLSAAGVSPRSLFFQPLTVCSGGLQVVGPAWLAPMGALGLGSG